MDFKKTKAPITTVTNNLSDMESKVGNIYEAVVICAKRSNQISQEIKQELSAKLNEFASYSDNLEEVFENREQIEVSKYYERLPKPTLIALDEFLDDKLYYRRPEADSANIESV
ncbi:MAG: DNA-directed RNA polymerase subunit omega [Bacteroidales bacterium]|nr:DNA-directed RNA polymerase subunit omega [Bacteroidales bacterium]HOY38692.1 DNA-directed RNA polymerase subunit omega [Bacteroidales bacterium]HQP03773.1 DNA-directed RNA polymerase subunit omega [Bacteroidales bacterium]